MTEPVIDSHHHLWDLSARGQPWTAGPPALRRSFGLDERQPVLDRNGVASTVLIQTVTAIETLFWLLELDLRKPPPGIALVPARLTRRQTVMPPP